MERLRKKAEESGKGKFFLISENNRPYHIFCFIVTISCLVSSYVYAYIAAFRMHPQREKVFTTLAQIGFELIFIIHMATQFILEYTPEGSKTQIKDYKKIAMRYIKEGDFYIDFIAIIPFQIV